ncbi:MAG: hypothetical protein FJ315_03705 [SAR202 cluster bacterium]|nr:hypothetical protein [SAR202 cluster bacterium]
MVLVVELETFLGDELAWEEGRAAGNQGLALRVGLGEGGQAGADGFLGGGPGAGSGDGAGGGGGGS